MAHTQTQRQISLLAYLQDRLPNVPNRPRDGTSRKNTEHPGAYGHGDIKHFNAWEDFTIEAIMGEYGNLLHGTRLPAEAPLPRNLPVVLNENAVSERIFECIFPRIRNSLSATFGSPRFRGQGMTIVNFDVGGTAKEKKNFRPDLAFFAETDHEFGQNTNRLPGEIKPSYKWRLALGNGDINDRQQCRQALSQVRFYAKLHEARYGFILTETELVAFYRPNGHVGPSDLFLSEVIPWEQKGTTEEPALTVLLALWYLGMLAARNVPSATGVEPWHLATIELPLPPPAF